MKKIVFWILNAAVCVTLVSCSQSASYESQADKAYNQSKKAQGYEKKMLEKRAYIFYQRVLKAEPNHQKLTLSFRQRFLEITLNRAYMVLNEGSYDMDALHLFIGDIDSILTKDSPSDIKQRYADFLSTMADSCISRSQINEALTWITKASSVVDNPSSLEEKKKRIIADYGKQYFDMAKASFEESKTNKDPEMAVKAEYYVQLVMVYDPNFPGAAQLLSELRKANVNALSGYAKVVDGKLDKRVNKFDILLAISKNTKTAMTVTMFNNSYNPQRLKPENFYLVDEKGQKAVATAGSKIDPEILDTEHETKTLRLVFPGLPGAIKKLVYENGEHYTEKCLF
jgi:tetratricopeptide (TPR) repeat protein